jgi:hypothetical protein
MASGAGSKGSVVLKDSDRERIRKLRREYIYPLDPMTSIYTTDSVKTESAKRIIRDLDQCIQRQLTEKYANDTR